MKNIEKQLIKSAKQLPSMQKEIVFSKKDDKIHNRKSFCAVAIAALSLMICFGVTLSINADYVEEVIKNIAKPEPVSSEAAPPPIINKTISVPINVSFEGDTSQTKSQQTDTYDVIEGDTVILDIVINDANIGNVLNIMSTINFDPAMLSFVSCTNNSYTQDASGTITVQYFGSNPQDQGTNFKMEFKAISSGSISFNSEINRTISKTMEINFIPNRISLFPGSDKQGLVLSNKVLFNGTNYAFTFGKNNGVDCGAIITVDQNNEYLGCVAILNTGDNESGNFTVCNGRIYYLRYIQNDDRDFKIIETFQIWSMNLSGDDKRQEKEISNSFTHIYGVNAIADSKYMILSLYNAFDFTYTYYRYDITTKEAVKISTPEYDEGFYIHNNQLFCYNSLKLYKYDINFDNKQLLCDLSQVSSDYVTIDLVQDGFMITVNSTNSKYFLDLNGNITKK